MERRPVNLKPFILLLLAWLVAVGLAIGGSILYGAYEGSTYEASAVPFVKEVVPVLSEWDADTTRNLVAPETLATLPEGSMGRALELFSKLGSLEEMEEPKFKEVVELPGEGDAVTTLVTYTVETRFSGGPAQFMVQLVDRGDRFQLYNFTLSSEVLIGRER